MTAPSLSKLFDLSGKVAVITGGAGIIGTAVSRGLAAHGADVAVVDIDGQGAEKLAGEIAEEYGVKAIKKHGALKGGYFTLKRILSCHPWGGHGHDPVP